MTLGELAALVMSRELMAPLGASVLGPAATAAFDKIQAVLSRDALIEVTVVVHGPESTSVHCGA